MTAGRKDRLVTLQTATMVQDDYGAEVPTWGPIGGAAEPTNEYAEVLYGRGDERRQAAMEQGQQAATFRMWNNDITRALTLKDRLVLDGDEWDITGIAPMDRQEIEVTATRSL